MVKLCFPPLLLKFFATPLNNKYHFRYIVLLFGFRIQAKLQTETSPQKKFSTSHIAYVCAMPRPFLFQRIKFSYREGPHHISAPEPGFSLDGPALANAKSKVVLHFSFVSPLIKSPAKKQSRNGKCLS